MQKNSDYWVKVSECVDASAFTELGFCGRNVQDSARNPPALAKGLSALHSVAVLVTLKLTRTETVQSIARCTSEAPRRLAARTLFGVEKSPSGGHSHSTLRCLWASRSFAAGWSMMQSTGTPSSSLVTARLTRLVTVNNLSYVSSAVTSPKKTPAVLRGGGRKEGRIKS